jgi:hypothetical protein
MRYVRAAFCAFSLVASLIALAHHLGYNLWGCASCSFVDDIPMSAAMAWGGPVVLGALTYALYLDTEWAKIVLVLAAAGSLALLTWMLRNNSVCHICVLIHIGVLSATLSLVPKSNFLGILFFSLAIAFATTGGLDQFEGQAGTAIFRPRKNEIIPPGHVFVLFGDPECTRCQMIETSLEKNSDHPQVLYRWALLPHSMYRSVRAATLMEMARIVSPANFEVLRKELARTNPPLTDDKLIEAARKSGVKGPVKEWLVSPSEQALMAIDDDHSTFQELGSKSLPTLAELSRPDASGMRTLRLVPFSVLGLP